MIIKIVLTLIFSVATAVLYRMGGSEHFKRFYRPIGVGLSVLAVLLIWQFPSYTWQEILAIISTAGASAGLSTTYWDFINKLLPVPDPNREYWWNFLIAGIFLGIAALPYAWITGDWGSFALRIVVLSILFMGWSVLNGNVVKEELGRGFLITATLPILTI